MGALPMRTLATAGHWALFAGRAAGEAFRPPYELREIARHVFELGARSAPLIAASGFAVGIVLSMHTRASLARFGAEALIPAGLGLALVRETGPLTAGLLLSGRIGARIGSELGAMKVTEQIEALEALAVDSFKYLVVTRVVACVMALPILTSLKPSSATSCSGGSSATAASSTSIRSRSTRTRPVRWRETIARPSASGSTPRGSSPPGPTGASS
jgi:ABC transport permease subunit